MKYFWRIKRLKKLIKLVNYSNYKGTQITSKGLGFLKDSLKKNQYLKEINFSGIHNNKRKN
jgi:Mn-dependent DtxR family transcriptional regulator